MNSRLVFLCTVIMVWAVYTPCQAEDDWFLHGRDYLAPEVPGFIKSHGGFWYPNIRGGNSIEDMHTALALPDAAALRWAWDDYFDLHYFIKDPQTLRRIVQAWLHIEEPLSSETFADRVVDKLDGLTVIFRDGELVPYPVEGLRVNPEAAVNRLCHIIDAVYEFHRPIRPPHVTIFERIIHGEDLRESLSRIFNGLPQTSGYGAFQLHHLFHAMRYLPDGYLAYQRCLRELPRLDDAGDGYAKILRAMAGNVIITGDGEQLPPPGDPSLIIGRFGFARMTGSDGDDVILGGLGYSDITGGRGDDFLISGFQRSRFYFYQGDGNDTVLISVMSREVNTLYFPDRPREIATIAIQPNSFDGVYDMKITFIDTDDSVFVDGFYIDWKDAPGPEHKVDALVFADGPLPTAELLREAGL